MKSGSKKSLHLYVMGLVSFIVMVTLLFLSIPAIYTSATDGDGEEEVTDGELEEDQEVLTYSAEDFIMSGSMLVRFTGVTENLVIPGTIESIGPEAFANTDGLKNVSFEEGALTISYNAFVNHPTLETVVLPESLVTIGKEAFANCASLVSVEIGSQVSELEDGAFCESFSLAEVIIDDDNPYYVVEDNVIYNIDQTKVIAMLGGYEESTYSMPSTVTELSAYACYGLEQLEKVVLSSSLVTIAPYAFGDCDNLSTINIPYSVRNIEQYAFANCSSLAELDIPYSCQNIHETAFIGSGLDDTEPLPEIELGTQLPEEDAQLEDAQLEDTQLEDEEVEEEVEEDTVVEEAESEDVDTEGTEGLYDIDAEPSSIFGETVIVNNQAVFY